MTIQPSRDNITFLEKQRLISLYAITVTAIAGGAINLSIIAVKGQLVSLALQSLFIVFLLLANILFWFSRRLTSITLSAGIGIFLFMTDMIIQCGGSSGFGMFYIFTLCPVVYMLLGCVTGNVLTLYFFIGILIRLSLGGFHPDSIFNNHVMIERLVVFASLATVFGITINTSMVILLHRVSRLAVIDRRTGLACRWKAEDYLSQRMTVLGAEQGSLALVAIQFQNYNRINAMLGTLAGDMMLDEIGNRLKGHREHILMSSRWNSNIFLLISDTSDFLALDTLCRSVLEELQVPFSVKDTQVSGQFTIAITRYPDDTKTGEQLISNAVSILDHNQGMPGELIFFSPESLERDRIRFLIAESLNGTDFETGFYLVYQPKINLRDGYCTGAEVLIRWDHPVLGNVSPSVFVPIAEESGVVKRLSRWVIHRAVQELSSAKYLQACTGHRLVNAINLSASDLKDQDLLPFLLRETVGTPNLFEQIEFEITEGVLIDENPWINLNLENLMKLGFRIAIDDFGTGYSSLSYLHTLKVNNLKIDRSFVKAINPVDASTTYPVVDAIISMGKSLGLEITAEGVETEAQAAYLRDRGCDYAQGWLNSKAITFDEYLSFIEKSFRE